MASFALAALLFLYPTIRFVSWNKLFARNQVSEISDQESSRLKMIMLLELVAIVIILFSAAMMACGVGMM